MIKSWIQFNESSTKEKVNISDMEAEYFQREPALKGLISDNKVDLIGNELIFDLNDEETVDILNIYLDTKF